LTAGTRRNDIISKFGLFKRSGQDGEQASLPLTASAADRSTGRHADPRDKTARKRVGRVVPAAGVAAALVVGAAAYGLVASSGHPQGAQLSADAALPAGRSGPTHGGVGVDSTASTRIRAAGTAGRSLAPASAKPKASQSAKAAAKPRASSAAAAPVAAAAAPATAAAAPATAAPRASSAARSSSAKAPAPAVTPAAKTLSCNLSDGMLPDNVTGIVSFLLANGYSDNAAAGIAGNMYQESKGNPESEGMGGGGLIGFTPLPAGYVTGNTTTDLHTQLEAVLTYNQQWSGYLPALNDAASPADAASIYVTDFERAGIPAASTREASAEDVASACGI
jgi:Phage tail lysozyme